HPCYAHFQGSLAAKATPPRWGLLLDFPVVGKLLSLLPYPQPITIGLQSLCFEFGQSVPDSQPLPMEDVCQKAPVLSPRRGVFLTRTRSSLKCSTASRNPRLWLSKDCSTLLASIPTSPLSTPCRTCFRAWVEWSSSYARKMLLRRAI